MTLLDILKGARELIATPEKWTKGQGARNSKGDPRDWDAPDVRKRCLFVAVSTMAKGVTGGLEFVAVRALRFRDTSALLEWHDAPERTHAEVLARLDAAIAAEEAKVSHA